jgi:hypothetical protein
MGNRLRRKTALPSQTRTAKPRLRRKPGSKPYDATGRNAYDGKSAVRKTTLASYAHARRSPVPSKSIVCLRSERGNLVTKGDASPAKFKKSLRGQFGNFYDQRKIGNSSSRFVSINSVAMIAMAKPYPKSHLSPTRSPASRLPSDGATCAAWLRCALPRTRPQRLGLPRLAWPRSNPVGWASLAGPTLQSTERQKEIAAYVSVWIGRKSHADP